MCDKITEMMINKNFPWKNKKMLATIYTLC